MPHHVKRIARTTGAKAVTYAGPAGELVMDITNNDLLLQNGQAGGVRLAKASTVIDATNGVSISTGGTLGAATVVSGVDASTAAKGVVQLSNATDGTSQTMAATPKAVSDALQAAKDYADTAGAPYSGTAPIAVDATNRVISVTDATTTVKGVVQLSNATDGTSQTAAATEKAVADALQAAKDYSDRIAAGLALKADVDMGNATAAGKGVMAHAAMPSGQRIDLSFPASGGTVTAPADGYICAYASGRQGTTNGYLSLLVRAAGGSGAYILNSSSSWYGGMGTWTFVPVSAGQSVVVNYYDTIESSSASIHFTYANGSAPQP